MADITALHSGAANDSGKVNWRGDQVSAPIGQSLYKTSSVPLAELGSRLVVGDRVFRYTVAAGAINAGDLAQVGAVNVLNVTAGGTDPANNKAFTFYSALARAADFYAEGMVYAQSGTAANMGHMYRIKSHPAVATTSNVTLTLYDPLVKALNVTDKWSIIQNVYRDVVQMAGGTAAPAGVAPILVTSADYFWLQTWGPCNVKVGAGAAAGMALVPDVTGQVLGLVQSNTVNAKAIVGYNVQIFTASERGLIFLTIAP